MRTQCGHERCHGENLSEETIKRLPVPARGNRITYFAGATIQGAKAPRGFGVRVTAAGARAFILNYRLRGREHRFTIGAWPDWSALKAVREARNLRQRIDRGENPLDDRAPSPDDEDRFAAFSMISLPGTSATKKGHCGAPIKYESAFNRLVKPRIGKLGVYEVRRSHISECSTEIEDETGPVMADRTRAYLRKAFSLVRDRDDQFNLCRVRAR